MVDRTNLNTVNQLYFELQQIEQAETNFEHGGRIQSMVVGGAAEGDPSAFVRTVDIEYPPQMTSAVMTALEQRRHEIEGELSNLGLTGIEAR